MAKKNRPESLCDVRLLFCVAQWVRAAFNQERMAKEETLTCKIDKSKQNFENWIRETIKGNHFWYDSFKNRK